MNKVTLPTAAQIMAFTQEEIEALPQWNEKDSIKLGGFAKQTWLKAKSSLVFIVVKDDRSDYGSVGYVHANPYNGYIDAKGYITTVIKQKFFCGTEFWRVLFSNPETFTYAINN